MFLSQMKPPARQSIVPQLVAAALKKDVSKLNLAVIYENDLFNTYIKVVQPVEEPKVVMPVPTPPAPKPLPLPEIPKTQFLPPLDVTLKGIIFVNNDRENRAIIANNKTKQEVLYRVGDRVEDADVIYIGKRKIIVLRANGQQETLFLTGDDAQADPLYKRDAAWNLVIKQVAETVFMVDPKALGKRIHNLAQLIDMLDLTTVFEKGRSIGCRIGRMGQQSIGPALGLRYGDVIISINGIATTTTKDRVAIYNQIKEMQLGDQILVKLLREPQEYEYTYVLKKFAQKQPEEEQPIVGAPIMPLIQGPGVNNPVVQEMKSRDKGMMLRNGGRRAVLSRNI